LALLDDQARARSSPAEGLFKRRFADVVTFGLFDGSLLQDRPGGHGISGFDLLTGISSIPH